MRLLRCFKGTGAFVLIAIFSCVLGCTPTIYAQPLYTVTGLGNGMPVAVNDRGVATGFYYAIPPAFSTPHTFIWSRNGGFQDITPSSDASANTPSAINEMNSIVGSFNQGSHLRAFLWRPGKGMSELAGFSDKTVEETRASGINDNNEIVGYVQHFGGQPKPCIWSSAGRLTELRLPTGAVSGGAVAINQKGQISGSCTFLVNGNYYSRAVLWQANGTPVNLGVLSTNNRNGQPYIYSDSGRLNDSGDVVGNMFNGRSC